MKIIEQRLSKQITLPLHGSSTSVTIGSEIRGIAANNETNDEFILDLNFELNWSLYLQLEPTLIDMSEEDRVKILSMIDIDEEVIAKRQEELEAQEDEDYIPAYSLRDTRIH